MYRSRILLLGKEPDNIVAEPVVEKKKEPGFAMVDDRDHLLPAMEKFVSMEITKDISRPDVPVDEVDEELTSIEEKQVKLDAS